jgi:hypothetical protein
MVIGGTGANSGGTALVHIVDDNLGGDFALYLADGSAPSKITPTSSNGSSTIFLPFIVI